MATYKERKDKARRFLDDVICRVARIAEVDQSRVVIIGGAVRDMLIPYQYPRDVDAFVLGADRTELAATIARHTGRILDRYNRHPQLAGRIGPDIIEGEIEIIAAEGYDTTDQLVDRADWNVSRFGYDGWFYGEEHLADIGPGKPLVMRDPLHKTQNPISTMRRGFLFADRFSMQFKTADVMLLSSLIAERKFPRSRVTRRAPARTRAAR